MRDWSSEQKIMKEAVESTLEQITFCVVQEVVLGNELSQRELVCSYITSINESNQSIDLSVSVEKSYLLSLVEDLYPDCKRDLGRVQDTLDELTNTIAGTFFRLHSEERAHFRLSLPFHIQPTVWKEVARYEYLLDDVHPLLVCISE